MTPQLGNEVGSLIEYSAEESLAYAYVASRAAAAQHKKALARDRAANL